MTMKKKKQLLCEDNLRHNEYYGMQNTIDNLYQASLNGEVFTDLMSVILQRENILLAYRNIKKNTGSKTNGTDNLTIEDIGRCSPDEVVEKIKDNKKYKVSITYKESNGLIDYITIEEL